MAKDKNLTTDTQSQSSTIGDQQITEKTVEQQKSKVEQKEPEKVLIGFEAFASAKNLPWTIKVRLNHYAEQNKVTEQTFDEWEKIVVQL
ncbi:MAG: hypothetical protein RDU14_16725 [Melioribacteraceae bacterium]|nr:hypothetical protein [Melioribacteraceae bacterium]